MFGPIPGATNLDLWHVIHPIHRFQSSDWLKEGHMTWIIFDNVHVWKLIHVCYFLPFPWLSKKSSQLPNLELDSLLSIFYGSVRTKKSMNKNKYWLLFYAVNGIKLLYPRWNSTLAYYSPRPYRPRWISRPRLNFTSGTIIFYHSPHEQLIFV